MQGTATECIAYLTRCEPEKRYEVKEARKKRTLTQNAYYWSMLNKLAAKLGMPDSEVHLNMLRDWGASETFLVQEQVPLDAYFRYYDVLRRLGASVEVKVYKPSSQMDSAEFTHLVQGMREECEAQGIDVMTPEEIASLRFDGPEGRS